MSIFDDAMGSQLSGLSYVNQRIQQGQQGRKQSALASLLGDYASGGQPDYKGIAANGGNPLAIRDDQQGQKQARLRELGQYAGYLAQLPAESRPQAYMALMPKLAPIGQELGLPPLPPAWDEAHLPELQALAQLGGGSSPGGRVQSTYVGRDGIRYAVMADGSKQQLGPAEASYRPFEGAGGVYGFDPRNNTAAPTIVGSGQPPQAPQSPQQPSSAFTLDDNALAALQQIPPQERATALQAMMTGGTFHPGANGQPVSGLSGGGQLQPAPKAPAANPETFGQPQTVLGADGKPQLVQFGNQGGQRPVQGAAPIESKQGRVSATQLRQANVAKAKMIDLQQIKQQIALLETKFGSIKGTASAGPFGMGLIPSEGGRQYDAAQSLLAQFVRKLTRTPGEGAMSDYETKLSQLANPSRNDYESVTQDKIDQLKMLVDGLEQGYGAILQDNGGSMDNAGGAPATPSGAGAVIRYDAQGNRIK